MVVYDVEIPSSALSERRRLMPLRSAYEQIEAAHHGECEERNSADDLRGGVAQIAHGGDPAAPPYKWV